MPNNKSVTQKISTSIKVRLPCEIVTEYFLPLIRRKFAQELVNQRGVSQLQVAKLLGVTQPAISSYINTRPRIRKEFQESAGEIERLTRDFSDDLLGGKLTQSEALGRICSLCMLMRNRGPICSIHADEVKDLHLDKCSICLSDLMGFRERSQEDYEAIELVRLALQIVEGTKELSTLIPEIGMNIVYAKPNAVEAKNVVGVPGRIHSIGSYPRSVRTPEFGGSSHVARAVLTMMKFQPLLRSAISLRFDWKVIEICRRFNLVVSSFDRAEEPLEVKSVDGRTIQWGVEQAIKKSSTMPTVIYDSGDIGKEPLIFLFGQTSLEVVQLAVSIAKDYNKSKTSTSVK